MKKLMLWFIPFWALILFACSPGQRTFSEEKLCSDLCEYLQVEASSLNVEDFSIIKRQTNAEAKEDKVWVNLVLKNDLYELSKNYVITNKLYNDGWLFESVSPYHDKNIEDYVLPLQGIDMESWDQVDALVRPLFERYRSFSSNNYELSYKLSDSSVPVLEKNKGTQYANYTVTVQYHNGPVDEEYDIPIYFTFSNTGDLIWTWKAKVLESKDNRCSMQFNDDILGTWTSHGYDFRSSNNFYAEATITDYQGDKCYVNLTHVFSDGTHYKSGWMQIDQQGLRHSRNWKASRIEDYSERDALLVSVQLNWVDGSDEIALHVTGCGHYEIVLHTDTALEMHRVN